MDLKKTGWITKWWSMWLLFFFYTAAAAAFVQLILIPHFLPAMDLGHGLFSPDSAGFSGVALEQVAAMMKHGWNAWQLFPRNHYPAGMTSIFYYLWCPEPFTLIPFNAALHATAGCLVFFVLFSFIEDRMAAFGGAALFVLNPASLEWTAQIHRDGTFILGNLLVLVSWLLISKGVRSGKWQALIYSAFTFFMGALMVWVARPYWIQIVYVSCAVLATAIFFYMVIAWHRSGSVKSLHIASVLLLCLMLMVQKPFLKKGTTMNEGLVASLQENLRTSPEGKITERGRFKDMTAIRNHIHGLIVLEGPYKGVFFPDKIEWHFSPLTPHFIESKLFGLASYRLWVAQHGGRSLIDPEVQFMSIKDYLLYLPRALQVGFLSPFPSVCFSPDNRAGMTVVKTVLGIVTIFFYICIAFFIGGARTYVRNRDFWLIVLYSTCGLLIYTYTYPNYGTLARSRYGFFMMIVSIGFAFAILKLQHKLQRINSK